MANPSFSTMPNTVLFPTGVCGGACAVVRVRVRVRARAIVDHCAYPLRLPVVLPQPEAVNDNKKGGKSKKSQRGPDLEALVPDEVLLLIFSNLRDDVTSLCQAACACRRYVIKAVVHVQWYQKSLTDEACVLT